MGRGIIPYFFYICNMKECTKCKEVKELTEFSKDKCKKDGIDSWCKACRRNSYKNNSESRIKQVIEYQKKSGTYQQYRKNYDKSWHRSKKDGLHHVYYLPDHNYVGITDNLYFRMNYHKTVYARNTDNYQILASFDDRSKALRFESLLHDSGFEG